MRPLSPRDQEACDENERAAEAYKVAGAVPGFGPCRLGSCTEGDVRPRVSVAGGESLDEGESASVPRPSSGANGK